MFLYWNVASSVIYCGYLNILREKSLAIYMYFGDSQFRRNRTLNLKVSKIYVDKRSRVRWHNQIEISLNVKSDFIPLCLNSLSGNNAISFRLKVSLFCQMFRSKSKKVKNGIKLNVMFTLCVQFLVENRIFPNYLPFNWITFEIKMLSRSNPHYDVGFCFF